MVEESATPLFSQVTGVYQGRYTASSEGADVRTVLVIDGDRTPVTDGSGNPVDFKDFVALVRQEIPGAMARPLPDRTVPESLQHLLIDSTPSKRYAVDIPKPGSDIILRPATPPPTSVKLRRPSSGVDAPVVSGIDELFGSDGLTTRWSYEYRAWDLSHQFNRLSVMNYAPHKYRAYSDLYSDDVAAVRSAFSSDAVSRTDLGVALFYSSGFQDYSDSSAFEAFTSLCGGVCLPRASSINVSDFVIENSGTVSVAPAIDWWLVPSMNSSTNARFLKTTTHDPAVLRLDEFDDLYL